MKFPQFQFPSQSLRSFAFFSCFIHPLAADVIITEDFETDGQGVRYLGSNFTDNSDVFDRHNFGASNPYVSHADAIETEDSAVNHTEWAYVAEDISDTANPLFPDVYASTANAEAFLRLADVDVSGFSNLRVTVSFAVSRATGTFWEDDEFIAVESAFDADSGGISDPLTTAFSTSRTSQYTRIGAFLGADFSFSGLQQDVNLDGVVDGPALNSKLTRYTFPVIGSGSSLSVQIRLSPTDGSEEIVFDEIIIEGDPVMTNPPALAGIESSAIEFTEGDSATQVTGSITVADSDSLTLSAAQVSISSGFSSGEDVLTVTPAVGGITASYAPATGVLSLSGNASLADYQTTLRSVTYQNTNTTNPSTEPREISFLVTDEAAIQSNIVERDVNLTATIGSGTIPFTETFETDGEGVRYLSNTHDNGGDAHFERHDFANSASQHPGHFEAVSGVEGAFAWASEFSDANPNLGNPLGTGAGTPNVIRFYDLDATDLADLQVAISLGSSIRTMPATVWETTNQIEIQAAWDTDRGSAVAPANPTLLSGSYTTVGRFIGTGVAGQNPVADADLDGVADMGGAELSEAMGDFTFDISGVSGLAETGSVLSVQIKLTHGGGEEIVFDNIRVTGIVPDTEAPTAALSNPSGGAFLTSAAANALGFIDVTFSDTGGSDLDLNSIIDAASEISLSGTGVGTASVSGPGVLQSGTTYRYPITGTFSPGTVNVDYIAGSFADNDANSNIASSESFTVTNLSPTAGPDTITRNPGGSVKVSLAFLLGNDSDPEGTNLTISSVSATGGNGATVVIVGDFVFYAPNGHTGDDTFEYTLVDEDSGTATGVVSVDAVQSSGVSSNLVDVETGVPLSGGGTGDIARFVGIPGRSYTVQTSETMALGSWSSGDVIEADAQGWITFEIASPPATLFFRALIE